MIEGFYKSDHIHVQVCLDTLPSSQLFSGPFGPDCIYAINLVGVFHLELV